ncbi:L,D-transpeptidase family protein [Spirosoma aureum]|uniref:L,D-transpeptidase family protein n=1 Tax=Spirosoma aureum TaxID=2692134 RepID=A0A6G9ARJ5_9BACT|nr:L,D-transpeptidase family protein [Spirosoma aureum]QIP15112.1 L,D-transpeptidase family protein [Spirosoma aureum]
MLRYLLISLLLLPSFVNGQKPDDWSRLCNYATAIGVDSLCANPDAICLKRYFTQIIYGRTPYWISYQGVVEHIDTVHINQLTSQFMAGMDWCPLLDSLESHDRYYRQLKEYCMRCLIDDYMADSLTIEQIQETLNTYRWLNRFDSDKRIIINIPSATLRVIDRRDNSLLWSRVVVGKTSTPTPRFTALIPSFVIYPYWNIPRSIAVNELLPKIRKNPVTTLDALNVQILNTNGKVIDPKAIDWAIPAKSFPYRLRQSTGCDNALGVLKFNVISPYDVYVHDTNVRKTFSRENRFLSHGCIRVEKPIELANLLLGYNRLSRNFLTSCARNAIPQTINLPNAVPLIIIYNLLDLDEAGAVQVFKDVYGLWRLTL